jgi:heptosyltransferase I
LHAQSNFRLLVVRLGAMGDILHALPAVTALRLKHPEWTIDWVIEPRWRALLAAEDADGAGATRGPERPLIDRIYLAPAKEWGRAPLGGKTIRQISALRRELRAGQYDAVLDFQGAVRSAAIARFARSPRLIGEAEPREFAARWFFTERVAAKGTHVIEQDQELAEAIAGEPLAYVEPLLPVSAAAEAWCDTLLASSGSQRVVLINPGAGWGAKRWPVERYAEAAVGLMQRGLRVLVNAGPGEEPLAHFIERETRGAAAALACTLDRLIALMRRVTLAIAGDTGPLHLASALGRAVVGIYGPTDPSRNGPFGTRSRVLRSPESRRDHARRSTPEAGMLTISPEDVLRAADELIHEANEGAP